MLFCVSFLSACSVSLASDMAVIVALFVYKLVFVMATCLRPATDGSDAWALVHR